MLGAILAAMLQAPSAPAVEKLSFHQIEWTAVPSRRELGVAYPSRALRKSMSGRVVMACRAGAKGQLLGCTVTDEAPAGEGFGAAALSLAGDFRLKQTRDGRAIAEGTPILLPIQFRFQAITLEAIQATHPKLSDGKVVLDCRVTSEGRLDNCVAMEERPADAGLRDIAIKLSARMTFGEKSDALERIVLPIEFRRAAGPEAPPPKALIPSEVEWRRQPTASDFARVYPSNAKAERVFGEAVMLCVVGREGLLEGCLIEKEHPVGAGFGEAALKLAEHYRLGPRAPAGNRRIAGELVRMPLRFGPPRR